MSNEPARDSIAVVALVLGVASLTLLCWYPLSVPTAIAAIACGYAARRSPASAGRAGMARIGMICGGAALIMVAVIIILPH